MELTRERGKAGETREGVIRGGRTGEVEGVEGRRRWMKKRRRKEGGETVERKEERCDGVGGRMCLWRSREQVIGGNGQRKG